MDTSIPPPTENAADDNEVVAGLLGRRPKGQFEVVVRDDAGVPVVIRNHPLLEDGRPMPTRFWLVGNDLRSRIGTLESTGGVRAAEADCDPAVLADAHARYAEERDAAIPEGPCGSPTLWRGGWDKKGRQVSARPLRMVPGRRGRPGGSVGACPPERGARPGG